MTNEAKSMQLQVSEVTLPLNEQRLLNTVIGRDTISQAFEIPGSAVGVGMSDGDCDPVLAVRGKRVACQRRPADSRSM